PSHPARDRVRPPATLRRRRAAEGRRGGPSAGGAVVAAPRSGPVGVTPERARSPAGAERLSAARGPAFYEVARVARCRPHPAPPGCPASGGAHSPSTTRPPAA